MKTYILSKLILLLNNFIITFDYAASTLPTACTFFQCISPFALILFFYVIKYFFNLSDISSVVYMYQILNYILYNNILQLVVNTISIITKTNSYFYCTLRFIGIRPYKNILK